MAITREDLINAGYEVDKVMRHAIYILPDGTMWDGNFDMGKRGVEHREVEVFTRNDRYDGDAFWEEVFLEHGLVMVIPETKTIVFHPRQQLTDEQIEVSNLMHKFCKYNPSPL